MLSTVDETFSPQIQNHYDIFTLISLVFFSTLIILNLICSLSNTSNKWFESFNVRENIRQVVSSKSSPRTCFINRWKFFYTMVSHFLHCLIPTSDFFSESIDHLFKLNLSNSISLRFLYINLSIVVSYNFIMSGALVMYKWRKAITQGTVSFSTYVIFRIIASLPITLCMICLYKVMPYFVHNQSIKNWATVRSQTCSTYGWFELIFLSNFLSNRNICNIPSWFTSANMQLYVVSFPIVIFMSKLHLLKQSGFIYCASVITLTMIIFLFVYFNVDQLILLIKEPNLYFHDPNRLLSIYFNTIQYLPAYIVGLFIGSQIACSYQWSSHRSSLYFYSALVVSLASLFLPVLLTDLNNLLSLSSSLIAFLMTIQRVVFISAISVTFFASWSSSNTRVTLFDWFLSIFSQMQYTYFLLHLLVIAVLTLVVDIPYTSYEQIILTLFPLSVIFSFMLTLIIHLTVERPLLRLFMSLLMRKETADKNTINDTSEGHQLINQEKYMKKQ